MEIQRACQPTQYSLTIIIRAVNQSFNFYRIGSRSLQVTFLYNIVLPLAKAIAPLCYED